MKRFVIYAMAAAFVFMLSSSAPAVTIFSEQKGTEYEGKKAENTFNWSHALKYSGKHNIEPFKFNYSFGPSEGNQDWYQSGNGLLNAFKWSHSLALSAEPQENPFRFTYQYGQLIDVDGSYMSMNGPTSSRRQGDVLDTSRHFYYYESCGLGDEPDTGYIPPDNSQPVPEPMSILLMGFGSLWIINRH